METQTTNNPGTSVITSADPPLPFDTLTPIQIGILQTISYADVFDYPLTPEEIHRYLVGIPATRDEIRAALDERSHIEHHGGLYTLPGRSALIETRRRRAEAAAHIWTRAQRYGRLIARLPFVRMVAVTGALAVNNSEPGDDIDYLVVTAPGHLWLCRAFVILLVKIAALRGDVICPNYFLAEEDLALPERDLFTAHELAQMVPIAGQTVYQQMMRLNDWTQNFLPNASNTASTAVSSTHAPFKALLELVLSTPLGNRIERWEMSRKIARFNRQAREIKQPPVPRYPLSEIIFNATQCKGHFNHHGEQTLEAYDAYLQRIREFPTAETKGL